MSAILGIDPGPGQSAYALIDHATRTPIEFDKVPNRLLLARLERGHDTGLTRRVGIEMIASYGMPVGRDVFDTCVWVGRFHHAIAISAAHVPVDLIYRKDVKVHHCHSSKASDANISQALKDRFAYGVRNHGKGTKDAPGWFYGFKADVWQAYALAVHLADITPLASAAPVTSTPTGAADIPAGALF